MGEKWKLGLQKVKEGVYAYITEGYTMMSNAALIVGDDCALVFDSLTCALHARQFREACRQVTDKPIRYLVISHRHGDHTLGSGEFPEAVMVAHRADEPFYAKEAALGTDRWEGRLFPWVDFTGSRVRYPDVFIDSDTTFELGGRQVVVRITKNLHTEVDLYAVVPDANVVCCGDLLFSQVCANGRPQGIFDWVRTEKSWIEMDADAYIPGHGPVCGKEGLVAQREFQKKVIQGYMKMCAGKTLDQAVDELDWSDYAGWVEPGRCYSDMDRLYAAMTNGTPAIPIDPKLEKELNERILQRYRQTP